MKQVVKVLTEHSDKSFPDVFEDTTKDCYLMERIDERTLGTSSAL